MPLLAALAATALLAPQEPDPRAVRAEWAIEVAISWRGEPCNAGGLIWAEVKNRGPERFTFPNTAYLGIGGEFVGRVRATPETDWTISDNYLPPRPPPPPGGAAGPPTTTVLESGGSIRYPLEVGTANEAMLGGPHYALETGYGRMRKTGGQVGLVFIQTRAPEVTPPYFTVDLNSGPALVSNNLVCPAG